MKGHDRYVTFSNYFFSTKHYQFKYFPLNMLTSRTNFVTNYAYFIVKIDLGYTYIWPFLQKIE